MDTNENRPENEVPEPPMPVADQVSNEDRPEGSAEDEEKKEVNLQAAHWVGGKEWTTLVIPLHSWIAKEGDKQRLPSE